MSLLSLFFLFMYIGLSTIGGGLVSISLMQQELVSRGIISAEKFIEMIAVSESTPGPIGINMATYIGYELYGIWGSIILTSGIVLPSLIIIIGIAYFSASLEKKRSVQNTFYGLRAGAAGMITAAAWKVFSVAVLTFPQFYKTNRIGDVFKTQAAVVFMVFLIIQIRFPKLHPVVLILAGGVLGVLFF